MIVLMAVLLFTFAAKSEPTNGLSTAEIKGRELAQKLCDAQPECNYTNTGTMNIRNAKGTTRLPIKFETSLTGTNWVAVYSVLKELEPLNTCRLSVFHVGTSNQYSVSFLEVQRFINLGISSCNTQMVTLADLPNSQTINSFAGSDFWVCDLGLEFFHWPAQKVLPNTTRLKRGRGYNLLESTNPNPPTNGYSRVLSWIDLETGGILQAEAYDAKGKLLKTFEPKSFKKINGQWELQEMEIRNVQTGSRTRLEFDLKKTATSS
jgi:hypothetical protein